MALSNIRREPQREITESFLGVAVTVGLIVGDYWLAKYVVNHIITRSKSETADLVGCMFCIPLVTVLCGLVIVGIAYGTHAIGEGICGFLARRGLDPRPKIRK